MKRSIKTTALLLLLGIVSLCFYGCGNKETRYESDAGIAITMDSGFYEKEHISYTYYLESQNSIFIAIKEPFDQFYNAGLNPQTLTLKEYAKFVMRGNNLSSEVIDDTENNLVYFEFEKNVSSKDFYYFATVYKTSDSFWLCQFACLQKSKDTYKSNFINWAKTVEFI